MKLPGVKDIDELASEADNYHAIITPYPSLADSLDGRTSAEVTTPRRVAYSGEDDYRREIFLSLASSGMNWKRAAHLLTVTISCWRNTGGLEKLRDYGYSDDELKTVKKSFETVDNPISKLDDLSIKGDIALLHPEKLNQLEKNTLPKDVDVLEFRSDEGFQVPEMNSFASAGTLVRSLIENVERFEPSDIGIVVSPESKYRSLIESMLEANEIPFQKSKRSSESNDIRTYINLLRAALSGQRARLRDLRPILNQLDIAPAYNDDNKFISSLDGDISEFKEFFNVLTHLTFEESIEKLDEFGYRSSEVSELLEISGIMKQDITESNLERFEYFVRNYSPEERSQKGVLLADPRETVRVDREKVFFIGIDQDWNSEIDEYPWMDEDRFHEIQRNRVMSLLQSGRQQIYMIQKKEMEQTIRPCHVLTELLDEEPSSFEQMPHRDVRPESFDQGEGFEKTEVEAEMEEIETLSQSSLNTLAQSPRLYYFDRLLPSEDRESMAKGRLFHDFAEFYVNYPKFVEELDQEELQEFFLYEMDPFIEDIDQETLTTEVRLGLRSIKQFIDEEEIDRDAFPNIDSESKNSFVENFDKEVRFNLTELSFDGFPELKANGKIDLAVSETRIADFKSGRKYSKKKKVEASRVQTYDNARFPDFQPIMYLAFMRTKNREEKLEFTFFHFLHDLGEQLRNGSDLDEMKLDLTYYPETFDEYKSREEVFEDMTSGVSASNDRRKTLEKIGYDAFQEFMENHRFPETFDKKSLMSSEFVREFEDKAVEYVGDYKYVRKGIGSAARKLLKKRQTNFFEEDLDMFEYFLAEKIDEVNRYKKEGFPVDAKIDDLPEKDLLIK